MKAVSAIYGFDAGTLLSSYAFSGDHRKVHYQKRSALRKGNLNFSPICGRGISVTGHGTTVEQSGLVGSFGWAISSRCLQNGEIVHLEVYQLHSIGVTLTPAEAFSDIGCVVSARNDFWGVNHSGMVFAQQKVEQWQYGGQSLLQTMGLKKAGVIGIAVINNSLHVYLDDEDMGVAVSGVPDSVYLCVQLLTWGTATVVDISDFCDDVRIEYDQTEKERLVKTCTTKVVFAGDTEAGKSSIVRSIKMGDKRTVKIHARTEVIDLHNWCPEELNIDGRNLSVILADLGGHSIYYKTLMCFSGNDTANVIVMTHKINNDAENNYRTTYKWLRNLVCKSSHCKFLFALTQIDLVKTEQKLISLGNSFLEAITALITEDLKRLEAAILHCKNKNQRQLNQCKDAMDTLQDIYGDVQKLDNVFFLSCAEVFTDTEVMPKWDQSEQFRKKIISICKDNFIEMPEVYQMFYTEIGQIGLRYSEDTEGNPSVPECSTGSVTPSNVESVPRVLGGLFMDFTFLGWITRGKNITCMIKSLTSSSPKKGIHDSIHKSRQIKYLTLLEARKVFAQIQSKYPLGNHHSLEECLAKLHSLGLLYWFDATSKTCQFIFNHVSSFIDLLRSIFDYKTINDAAKNWDSLSVEEKELFGHRKDVYIANHHNMLFDRGIMTHKMLHIFLKRSHFEDQIEFVIDLLSHLQIWYKLESKLPDQLAGIEDKAVVPLMDEQRTEAGDQCVNLFFPYYVDHFANKNEIDALKWISKCSKSCLSRTLQFNGYISRSMFYQLCVSLNDYIDIKSLQLHTKYVWCNGLFVHLGNVALAMVHHSDTTLYCSIKCNAQSFLAVCNMWMLFDIINNTFMEIVCEEWPGAVTSVQLLCPVCVMPQSPKWKRIIGKSKHTLVNILTNLATYDKCDQNAMDKSECGVFEEHIKQTAIGITSLNLPCGCTEAPFLYLPPIPYGDTEWMVIPQQEMEDYVESLRQCLLKFEDDNTQLVQKFSLGCVSLCKFSQHVSRKPFSKGKVGERECDPTTTPLNRHHGGLFCTTANHNLTDEQLKYVHQVSPSVCCIYNPAKAGKGGTGMVVGALTLSNTHNLHRFVLTCNHIGLADAFRNDIPCQAEFHLTHTATGYHAECVVPIIPCIWYASQELDYCLVCLEHSAELEKYLKEHNAVDIGTKVTDLIPFDKDPLILIGHQYREKSYDFGAHAVLSSDYQLRPQILAAKQNGIGHSIHRLDDSRFISYQCHSFSGASGGPCFSAHTKILYAMHCGGVFAQDDYSDPKKSIVEFGLLLWSVVKDIKAQVLRSHTTGISPTLDMSELYKLFPNLQYEELSQEMQQATI